MLIQEEPVVANNQLLDERNDAANERDWIILENLFKEKVAHLTNFEKRALRNRRGSIALQPVPSLTKV